MISFAPPRIDQEIIDAVTAVLRSGWITTGPETKKFEQKLAEYCGVEKVLCLNSATAGLELALRWFGVQKGDEVIIPAYTYAATANVILHCGAKPVMVEVGKDFNVDIRAIANAISKKTKVIIPVDIAGWPCDYDALNALITQAGVCKKFSPSNKIQQQLGRILLLADAAHSLGAVCNEKRTGSLSDIAAFSFHAVKNLTTAEGGALALNLPKPFDNTLVQRELSVKALHGQTRDAIEKFKGGGWRYDIVEAGYKYNMTDIQAAMGLVEMHRYEMDTLQKRKKIFDFYNREFSTSTWAELPPYIHAGRKSSFHVYALRVKGITEAQRDRIITEITGRGVSVNVHFVPLPMLSFYKTLGYDIKNYPVAYDNYAREISLPVFYDLSEPQMQQIVEAVRQAVETVIHS